MVTEDYVSFETAKFLKARGFNNNLEECYRIYDGKETEVCKSWYKTFDYYGSNLIQRPTLQMALKWVIDKYNVHISPYCCSLGWYFDIFDLNQKDVTGCKRIYCKGIPSRGECYKTKEAAADAGLLYYLHKVR